MRNLAHAHGVRKHAGFGLFLANFHFLIMLLVVDKTGLPVSRRLGPFPRVFTRGIGSSWVVAGSPVLSTTKKGQKKIGQAKNHRTNI